MRTILVILSILGLASSSFSQTGTIKVEKKTVEKIDTTKKVQLQDPTIRAIGISVAGNYTFNDINKYGFETEVSIPFLDIFRFGIVYSRELNYQTLQPYDPELLSTAIHPTKSVVQSDYIKIPIGFSSFLADANPSFSSGSRSREFCVSLGLAPEYLLQTKDQFGLLEDSDFRRFNISIYGTVGIPLGYSNFSVNLGYSHDFFNNLKNDKIYNTTGEVLGKRKSRTNTTTLSITYRIQYAK